MADRGNWTDKPCWYCSVQDAGQHGIILGPFSTETACREYAYSNTEDGGNLTKHGALIRAAESADPRAWFYAYGMVKMPNGHREGVLNSRVEGWE